MSTTDKKTTWNRRKGKNAKNDEDLSEGEFIEGDLAEQNDLIHRTQYRLGVSRDEAIRIIQTLN